MITYVEGDVFDKKLLKENDFFLHLANCHKTMGAGVALGVKHFMPELYQADLNDSRTPKQRLGSYSTASVTLTESIPSMRIPAEKITGVNIYGQFYYGREQTYVRYKDLEAALLAFHKSFELKETSRIIMPMMGSGLAGGSWKRVEEIIGRTFPLQKVTVVIKKDQ